MLHAPLVDLAYKLDYNEGDTDDFGAGESDGDAQDDTDGEDTDDIDDTDDSDEDAEDLE